MSFLLKIFYLVRGFLFPCDCALCAGSLISAGEMRIGLCGRCKASFKLETGRRCNLCGMPLISERENCLSCRNGAQHSYDRLWVLFPYTGVYRKLLSAYKFEKNLALADFLAEKVWEVIDAEPELKGACIVPVPPRPGKIKSSGWDQIDFLVKRMEKFRKEGLDVRRCLKRSKSNVQKRLSRTQRVENLRGRIALQGQAPVTALVIDDVITTGSTMEVCSASLKEGGSKKVYGLCLFYD